MGVTAVEAMVAAVVDELVINALMALLQRTSLVTKRADTAVLEMPHRRSNRLYKSSTREQGGRGARDESSSGGELSPTMRVRPGPAVPPSPNTALVGGAVAETSIRYRMRD
eukprot:scaffold87428_cov30-Tisochrysis_lutea.AAC.2